MLSLTPGIMIGIGLLWRKRPPRDINGVYGYRTTWSMKNQETWDFAHRLSGRIWLYLGVPIEVLSVIVLIVFQTTYKTALSQVAVIIMGIQIVILCLPIIIVEKALRKNFDKYGRPL
jgi:uncharacterized membrane protein